MSTTSEAIVEDAEFKRRRQSEHSASATKFEPGLEREYRRFFLAERRDAICSVDIALAFVVGAAIVSSIWGESLGAHLGQVVRLTVIELAWLSMAAVACSRHFERFYLPFASGALLLIGVLGAIEIGLRIPAGESAEFGLLTAYSLGLFFVCGLSYRTALIANVALVIAFAATVARLGVSTDEIIALILLLVVTATIGGFAFRQQELSMRRSFLDRRLIADMAMRDGLTGLRNRRAFDEHLMRTWRQAERERCDLALLMIDVDHFKQFNDLYGHQAGDEALKRIAVVTEQLTRRPLDMAARFGGEEFAVILFDLSEEHAVAMAESLRESVEGLAIAHAENSPRRVTVSVGVAMLRPTAEQSQDIAVTLADEAMYSAKRDGRNRVRVREGRSGVSSMGARHA